MNTEAKIEKPELSLLRLIDETKNYIINNKDRYSQSAMQITDSLYRVFFNKKLSIIGINHRLKSPESLKEKILRKKLYKNSTAPQDIIAKMPDLIGIMIECEFISDEEKIFNCIKEAFDKPIDGVFFQNSEIPNIYINLEMKQPVRQKNGNELYKLDCYFVDGNNENSRINFELQIKSLVNSFWCEVEHNIVYKNNHYIASDDYVSEMLSAVRINLVGLDRILELINGRISALTAYNVVKDLKMNAVLLRQMVSDLMNEKMIRSIGFTVEAKRIRDLLAWFILRQLGDENENDTVFYELSERFKELHKTDFRFDRQILFKNRFQSEDIFSRIIGSKIQSLMNTDFEWHAFFIMLFVIDKDRDEESIFAEFIETLKALFCGGDYYKALFDRLPREDAQSVSDEAQMFIAEALCRLGDYGILSIYEYQNGLKELNGFMQYTLNSIDNLDSWVQKRSAVQSIISKSLRKSL